MKNYKIIQKKTSNPTLARKSKDSLILIKKLNDDNFIDIRGEQNDNFADNVFQVVFTKFRMQYKLLLITQDNNLAKDILSLNNNKSVQANIIHVKKINNYGFLSKFPWDNNTSSIYNLINENEIFKICNSVTKLDDSKLTITHIPTENETIYTLSHGEIKLENIITDFKSEINICYITFITIIIYTEIKSDK